MKMLHTPARRRSGAAPRQRGVVMLFGLFALAIMLIAAAAMIRSYGTAMTNAGNLGFKRDLTNQAERAVGTVLASLQGGALGAESTRQSSSTALNYSATLLPSNAQGLPNDLVADSSFSTIGVTTNDIAVTEQAVTMRYVVDRMCANTGAATPDHCVMADDLNPQGGNSSVANIAEDAGGGLSGALGQRVVYRISIRVTGPRNTQAFFQTTVTL
jgi:type IV pilus assembly protein PilX